MNMDLYGLFSYGDSDGVKVFTLAHRFSHDAEAAALAAQGAQLGTYSVGGEEASEVWIAMMKGEVKGGIPRAMANWLELHNDSHQAMLTLLPQVTGTAAVDLSMVDFRDPSQMYEWLTLHQELHMFEQQALGLT